MYVYYNIYIYIYIYVYIYIIYIEQQGKEEAIFNSSLPLPPFSFTNTHYHIILSITVAWSPVPIGSDRFETKPLIFKCK